MTLGAGIGDMPEPAPSGPDRPEKTLIEPMEARSVDRLPLGTQWQYEPKWDGFRCLLERDGNDVMMTSKSGRSLLRYFPEVAIAASKLP
jgi:ATP-dependent DNA ligase